MSTYNLPSSVQTNKQTKTLKMSWAVIIRSGSEAIDTTSSMGEDTKPQGTPRQRWWDYDCN